MLIVHIPFWSFLHQSCLKKRMNWENFSDPKASKIKPEQEKWCKRLERPSAFLRSKGVWPSLGLCLGDLLSSLTLFFHKYHHLLVIDVYQAWCGPCKAMQTLFRKLKNELNEDEILHFAVVRISFIFKLLFSCYIKYLSILFKDCLNLNNLLTFQNGQCLFGSFTLCLILPDLKTNMIFIPFL